MFTMRWRQSIFISLTIIVGTVLILLWMGRVPFCECGTIKLWTANTVSSENSQQFSDPYTFTHLIHGFGFYGVLAVVARSLPLPLRLAITVGLESGWEIIENTDTVINRYREATISLDYYGDSAFNVVGDILAAMLGFWFAARFPTWTTIAAFLVIELILIILIRDSLLLNIIMLLYPIAAIKTWQAGG